MPDYEATILADSVGPTGKRITTFEVCYPHIIHKEVMTHRVFSRSFMSMRAVPPERPDSFIDQVETEPFIPDFHGRTAGMGTSGPLPAAQAALAETQWLAARDAAVSAARILSLNNVNKSDVNPLLEPFLWMRGVITATEWHNFFALRAHEDARKEFQTLAFKMRHAYGDCCPDVLQAGEWHLPAVEKADFIEDPMTLARLSAGRLARISFDRAHMSEPSGTSIRRANRLVDAGHMSPFEHQAYCLPGSISVGNFIGWRQYRKYFENEDNYAKLTKTSH
jgi:hypothetical protein